MDENLSLIIVMAITVGSIVFIIASLIRSIKQEKKGRLWKDFSLSLSLMILFLSTWFAQGLAQWHRYASEQQEHGEQADMAGFLTDFSTSTLENWQSEFLQLFSFVALTSVFLHRGSAESRDGDDETHARLKRIEKKLDELSDKKK